MLQRIGLTVFLMFLLPPAWGQTSLSDTLIFYHITGFQGTPPIYNLAISTGGILQLHTRDDFTGSGDTLGARLNPAEFAQITSWFENNGFQDLLDSNLSIACLSCPTFILSYQGDSLRGNPPTQYENLNTIMAGLDSLIQELLDTSPIPQRASSQNPFKLYPDRLGVPFPHQLEVYDARGVLLRAYRSREDKEYPLTELGSPALINILNTSTDRFFHLQR